MEPDRTADPGVTVEKDLLELPYVSVSSGRRDAPDLSKAPRELHLENCTLLAALMVFVCVACSSSPPEVKVSDAAVPQQDATPDAAPPQDAAGPDANAASPETPQVASLAVTLEDAASPVVIPSPRFVPIFFASDDTSTTAQLTTFLSELVSSPYWASVVSEYGVGPATVHAPVQLTAADNPGATVDDSQIGAWLTQQLESSDAGAGLPPADGNTIFVFFYPAGTTVTFGGSTADGYHTMTSQNPPVPYAVLPRVPELSVSGFTGALSLSGFELLTFSTSHEMVEAVTDPLGTGYFGWDTDQSYWYDFLGAELADVCQFESPGTLASYTVARIWSNKAAAAGAEPCIPAATGEVYFNSAAILADPVGFTLPFQSAPTQSTKGVHIPVGESATVDLSLFSQSGTAGPWSVSAEGVDLIVTQRGASALAYGQASG